MDAWVQERVLLVLAYAVRGQGEDVRRCVKEIYQTRDAENVFALAFCLAGIAAKTAFGEGAHRVGVASVQTYGADGRRVEPEQAAHSPAARGNLWAVRTVAAYVNADFDTVTALINTSLDGQEQHVHDLTALIGLAAGIARDHIAELRAEGSHGAADLN